MNRIFLRAKCSAFFYWTEKNILSSPRVASLVLFLLLWIIFGLFYICGTGDTSVDDHLFHYNYASLLLERGWDAVENFDWIYLHKISSEGVRFQLSLYNVSLVPFTFFSDKMLGVKVVDTFFASAFLAIFYYVLRKSRVRYPLLFTLIMFTSSYFLIRVLAGRAFVLTIAFTLLEIYLVINKKYRKFFLVSVLHVMWHQATFFMPLLITVIVESARYLGEKKWNIKNNVIGFFAILLGMVIYSDFPRNIYSLVVNIFSVQEKAKEVGSIEGVEAINRDFMSHFILSFEFFFLITLISVFFVVHYYLKNRSGDGEMIIQKKEDTQRLVSLYAWFIFLIVVISGSLLFSGRLFDYYLPASIILFSLILTMAYEDRGIIMDNNFKKILNAAICVFVLLVGFGTTLSVKRYFAKFDQHHFKEAAHWISERSDDGDKIYLDNWSHFTVLFLYNDKNVYSTGLEPNDMLQNSPELYWKWYNFKKNLIYCEYDRDCSDIAKIFFDKTSSLSDEERDRYHKRNSARIIESIRDEFDAQFIVSDSDAFNRMLHRNGEFFSDVLQVKDDSGKTILEVFQIRDLHVE